MSNLSVANIVNPTTADTTPTDNLSKQVCKAWVNFNGIGVVTIRDSYNVASITDIGTGNYVVNFSTPMNDTEYSAVGGHRTELYMNNSFDNIWTYTTTTLAYQCFESGVSSDSSIISIQVFGS